MASKNFMTIGFLGIALLFASLTPVVHAQSSDDKEIESLYDKYDENQSRKRKKRGKKRSSSKKEVKTVSELSTLEPFSDIAVIQKKYLPTSGRFELSGSAMFGLNNAFFSNLGVAARMGYFFNSKWSAEMSYYALSATEKDVTRELKDRQVKTESLVTPKSYSGGAIKWTPVYGKMALLGKDIYQFETFFSLGFGSSETENGSAPTIQLGTGQNFAISKSMAFRWDATMNYYQPEVVFGSKTEKQNQYDIFVTFGLSFYFPEATYR